MLICGSQFVQYKEPKMEYNAQNGTSQIFGNQNDVTEIFQNDKSNQKLIPKLKH